MKELIKRLVEAWGPSGYEDQVREILHAEMSGLVDEWRVDALGNLITVKKPTRSGGRRVMLAAHMDEIGVMATYVDEQGFVRFTNIGSVHPLNLRGARVRFRNGLVGVIGREEKADGEPTLAQMFIDVGASSREDCPVKVGDPAVFHREFSDLGKRLVAKAFDDRISCAILVEVMRQLQETPHEVVAVFTVQEEVGLRGATTSAFGVTPDLALSVDVTATGDTPESKKRPMKLGAGPAIKVKDGGMLAHPKVKELLIATGERLGIPHQLEVLEFGTTDAMAIQVSRAGVPVGCVSIPTRYLHTPSEMVDYDDVTNAVRLIVGFLSEPIEDL
ncbi:MAG: M42 family metallopeptidase [Anaerolineae bacterium]|nr:M42 family metallopeptidase [Anaerolineae bacterium]MDW8100653.1 M42 family metallopeptidase [Anaerolineae bacterium]